MKKETALKIFVPRFRWASDLDTYQQVDLWACPMLPKEPGPPFTRDDCDGGVLIMGALLEANPKKFWKYRHWKAARRRAFVKFFSGEYEIDVWVKRKKGVGLLGHVSLVVDQSHFDTIALSWHNGDELRKRGWVRNSTMSPLDIAVQTRQLGLYNRLRADK